MRACLLIVATLIFAPFSLYGAIDKDLLALTPVDTTTVAGIDVVRARNSTFGQYMVSRMGADDATLERFITEAHFDPRKDLEYIVFASSAKRNSRQTPGVVLARGIFDVSQIEEAAKLHGAKVEAYRNHYIFVENSKDGKATGVSFPFPEIAVMGDLDTVRQILDRGGAAARLSPELQGQIDKVGSSYDAWFASSTGPGTLADHLMVEANGEAQPGKAFQAVLRSAGGLRFGNLMDLKFWAATRSPQDAASLRDVIRFFASMLQMQRDKDRRAGILAASLDNMDLRTSGDGVEVAFSLSEKDIEQIAELSPPPGRSTHSH